MNGFERRRQIKKDQIKKAALQLYWQYGMNKVTIQDIAKEASAAPMSIYNFFGSKEGLFEEIILDLFRDGVKAFEQICEKQLSFQERIEQVGKIKLEYLNSGITSLALHMIQTNEKIAEAYEEMKTFGIQYTQAILDEGKKEGFISPSLSSQAVMIFIDMYINYFLDHPEIGNAIEKNQKLYLDLYDIFWNALRCYDSRNHSI